MEFPGATILPLQEEWDMVDGVDVVDMVDLVDVVDVVDIAFGSFLGRKDGY